MSEYGIRWDCPYCNKWQNRICRVKNETVLTDTIIIQKARKAYLKCIYCGYKIKWTNLAKERKSFTNIQDKSSGVLNRMELR